MIHSPLQQNLAHLCGFYPSIADVCRRLGINRQQFNKYLSGQARPSRRNMRRICNFFGVTEAELLMDEQRFGEIIGLRRCEPAAGFAEEPLAHLERLRRKSGDLGRYAGYYFRYFYSFGYPGKIIKCLTVIYETDGGYYWKSVERLQPDATGRHGVMTSKYLASLMLLGDRIFAMEYDALMLSSITQAILYPSYHTSVRYLIGIQTGVPLVRGRKPAASTVLLEYIGRSIDQRKALQACGIFDDGDPFIDRRVKSLISNQIPDCGCTLEADEVY